MKRDFIRKDVSRYDSRWPERHFTLVDPVVLAPGAEPGMLTVHFRYEFAVKGRKYAVQGKVDNTYVLAGRRPEDMHIVSVKEQRVRE